MLNLNANIRERMRNVKLWGIHFMRMQYLNIT